MKTIGFVMLAAGLAVGCDKKTDEENALNLEGAWSKSCEAETDDDTNEVTGHGKLRLEFNGGSLSVIRTHHGPSDSNCETIWMEMVFAGDYVTGADADHQTAVEGATPLDLAMTSVKITGKTVEAISYLNTLNFCGKNDWTLDTAYEYTTADGCSDLSGSSDGGPPPPGQAWHQIFKADADNVYFGNAHGSSGNDGSTADKTPTELEPEPFTRAG